MTLPQALAAVVDLQHAHRELLRVVDSLKPEDWGRGVPYGDWTVKDLVAHCIGDMSPSGPGLIAAGVLTPQFIADTSKTFDVRSRNQEIIDERRRYTPEDLRQLLFEAHDARIEATLRLDNSHVPVLEYPVPMGPRYEVRVEDWLWYGYHDREHADDIRRALRIDWKPATLSYAHELDEAVRQMVRGREGLLRAIYSVADDAWDETAYAPHGWTYRQVLAHVATNDLRPQTRLRGILGEGDPAAMESILRTDEWNQESIKPLEGLPLAGVIDTMARNRHELMLLVGRLAPEHLDRVIRFADGREVALRDYIAFIGEHDSVHAGEFVNVSRRARHTA